MLLAQDEAVRIIIHYNDVMLLGKLHQSLVGLHLGSATSRHIGIIGPHELHLREVHLLQLVEVGLPAIILAQVIVHDIGTQNLR